MAAVPLYREGDVIFESEPWIYCILGNVSSSICYKCLQKPDDGVRRCSQCQFAHYCSSQCQKEDWAERHQPECKTIRRIVLDGKSIGKAPLDFMLIMCKLIPKLRRNETSDTKKARKYPIFRVFDDLMSHAEEFSRNTSLSLLYAYLKPYIEILDKNHYICPDFASFVRLYGKFNINAFNLADYYLGDTGKALYLGPSVIDHSCDPNAIQIFNKTTMIVKAVRDIQKFEDVRIAYISTFTTTKLRQDYLAQHYFFRCTCPACTDSQLAARRNALQCSNGNCAAPIPLDDSMHFCLECGANISERLISGRKCLQALLNDYERLATNSSLSLEDKLEILQANISAGERLLHHTSFILGILYRDVSNILEEAGRHAESIPYLQKALVSMRKNLSKYQSEVTGAMSEIMYWFRDTGRFPDAYLIGKELESILKIVPGQNTEVYQEYSTFISQCELAFMSKATNSGRETSLQVTTQRSSDNA